MRWIQIPVAIAGFMLMAFTVNAQGVNTNLFEENQQDLTFKVKKKGLFSKAESDYLVKLKIRNNQSDSVEVAFSIFIYKLTAAAHNTGHMTKCVAPGKKWKLKIEMPGFDPENPDYTWVFDDINVAKGCSTDPES
ncbi:hypothetical protein KFE98_11785 [bacterium SCSIO 12741]|nr:hypothetical protein KFE98_11785 [bacterium SCSIO 12741]